MVITAAPLARSAFTTPSAAVSLAIRLRLPFVLLILALSRRERPAFRLRVPLPVEAIAAFTVRSLLACNVTAVPAFSSVVIWLGVTVLLPPVLLAYQTGIVAALPPLPPDI